MSIDLNYIISEAIKKEVDALDLSNDVSNLIMSIVKELREKGYVDKDDLTDRINRIGRIVEGKQYD